MKKIEILLLNNNIKLMELPHVRFAQMRKVRYVKSTPFNNHMSFLNVHILSTEVSLYKHIQHSVRSQSGIL